MILKWAVERGFGVIPKCSSVSRLKENFECSKVALKKEDLIDVERSDVEDVRFCWDPRKVL